MRRRTFLAAVFLFAALFVSLACEGKAGIYKNDDFRFSMLLPAGYVRYGEETVSPKMESLELSFRNDRTREEIKIVFNKNTDSGAKAAYWKIYDDPRSKTVLLMKEDREGRVLSRKKIAGPGFEGFATMSENLTRPGFLLQEVKIFPTAGAGSAIIGFCYRAQNHPVILKVIDSIKYNY